MSELRRPIDRAEAALRAQPERMPYMRPTTHARLFSPFFEARFELRNARAHHEQYGCWAASQYITLLEAVERSDAALPRNGSPVFVWGCRGCEDDERIRGARKGSL